MAPLSFFSCAPSMLCLRQGWKGLNSGLSALFFFYTCKQPQGLNKNEVTCKWNETVSMYISILCSREFLCRITHFMHRELTFHPSICRSVQMSNV